ncbi:EamA family transporter [Candidatus Woesearchaeota archaeon]|nr:EamA family transporter [Candidatus Woesearchaeota archaeon]
MEWLVFILLSALFFGARQVVSKKVLMVEHATEYLTATCLMAFLFSLFFLPKMGLDYPAMMWFLMYIKALSLTVGWLLASRALRHLEISYVTPLTNLTPVFLLVWGYFILHEVPSATQYVGVALLIFGAYWLQADHHFTSLLRPWSIFRNKFSLFMIIAIFFYSICAALDKVILQVVDPYTFLAFTYFVLSAHYLLVQFFKYDGLKDIRHAFVNGRYLIFIIALLMIFSDVFYYLGVAMPGAMISLIIPVKRMSTLVAAIVGGRLFHDHNAVYRIIACVVMVMGVILLVL